MTQLNISKRKKRKMKSKEANLIKLNKNLVSLEEILRWASEGRKIKGRKR